MNPIRVMVVDDSVVVRKIVNDVFAGDPDIEVVGTAVNGRLALAKLDQLKPDLVTTDIEMPEMNGIESVRAIRAGMGARERRSVPIIMFSTLTERGASATLDALSAGANEYVTKPANVGSVGESMESVREQLIPKIEALTRILPQLPAGLAVPVLIVQHMPPVFTRQFAQRLDRLSVLRVVEAVDGTPLLPGTVHLAPGDHHLVVRGGARGPHTALNPGPSGELLPPGGGPPVELRGHRLRRCRPRGGPDRHGIRRAQRRRRDPAAGGTVVVQDQASSVVRGMPGAVASAGLADEVLPLERIPEATGRHLAGIAPSPTVATLLTGGPR